MRSGGQNRGCPSLDTADLIIQADSFNRSRIRTVVIVSSNIRLAEAPGNVLLPVSNSGLEPSPRGYWAMWIPGFAGC